jgi:hypothetical protein
MAQLAALQEIVERLVLLSASQKLIEEAQDGYALWYANECDEMPYQPEEVQMVFWRQTLYFQPGSRLRPLRPYIDTALKMVAQDQEFGRYGPRDTQRADSKRAERQEAWSFALPSGRGEKRVKAGKAQRRSILAGKKRDPSDTRGRNWADGPARREPPGRGGALSSAPSVQAICKPRVWANVVESP